jgi:hypothetical protein
MKTFLLLVIAICSVIIVAVPAINAMNASAQDCLDRGACHHNY